MSEVILGIDLGTTQSAVGVVDSGFPMLLADENGEVLTPSAVWFGEGETEVGQKALRRRGVSPVITSVKSLVGRRLEEVQFKELLGEENGVLSIRTPLGWKTPEEVSSEILSHLRGIAEERMGRDIFKTVITVPAYFNDGQRAATKKAGELAGLEVVRILSEPTAAALAYGLDRLGEEARVAVFDLGGGTFDVSILEMRQGVFEVIATAGDTSLGGDDFDQAIVSATCHEFEIAESELAGLDRAKWLQEARRIKHLLSEEEGATFRMPFVGEKYWSRDEFRELLNPFLKRMENCCRKVLLDSEIQAEELDSVIMVGGSSRIPAVREKVAALFKKEPDLSQHPDEAIARGAAIQAGILSGAVKEVVLLDVTPLSLGIETMGGLMNVLISRNTTIPCKAGEMFTNAIDNQSSMKVRVLQGERELADDNWLLGEFEVSFTAARKGQARVGVEFKIDADGILSVLARDMTTGEDTIVEIGSAAVDVTEAKVEQMVSESVEHAFEDMNARVFEEARMKAEELLEAVKMTLEQAKELVAQEEIAEIAREESLVREAISEGDAARLKSAVERMDAATEELAARLVEKATKEFFSP